LKVKAMEAAMADMRAALRARLARLFQVNPLELQDFVAEVCAPDARVEVSAPVGTLIGPV